MTPPWSVQPVTGAQHAAWMTEEASRIKRLCHQIKLNHGLSLWTEEAPFKAEYLAYIDECDKARR